MGKVQKSNTIKLADSKGNHNKAGNAPAVKKQSLLKNDDRSLITSIQNYKTLASGNITDAKLEIIEITIYNIHLKTPVEKMDIVRLGVTKQFLEELKVKAFLNYDLLAKALSVSRARLINKKGLDKFNSQVSEAIIGLADIYSHGYDVFKDEDRFNKWMLKPNMALGGQAPYYFLDNQFGREEIKNIIGRIDYGVYS